MVEDFAGFVWYQAIIIPISLSYAHVIFRENILTHTIIIMLADETAP